MNDTFRPRNQAECDHANTLREYEAAHKVWMNTSVFTEAGRIAKANKEAARDRYETALAANRHE
jgi:hypothetical protein